MLDEAVNGRIERAIATAHNDEVQLRPVLLDACRNERVMRIPAPPFVVARGEIDEDCVAIGVRPLAVLDHGDARLATPEYGKELVDNALDNFTAFVEELIEVSPVG